MASTHRCQLSSLFYFFSFAQFYLSSFSIIPNIWFYILVLKPDPRSKFTKESCQNSWDPPIFTNTREKRQPSIFFVLWQWRAHFPPGLLGVGSVWGGAPNQSREKGGSWKLPLDLCTPTISVCPHLDHTHRIINTNLKLMKQKCFDITCILLEPFL